MVIVFLMKKINVPGEHSQRDGGAGAETVVNS